MMKRYGISVCALASFVALAIPCIAQDNPWNGSWKIDRSTLKYDGPTVSIATDADGYTVTRDGKASPKVVRRQAERAGQRHDGHLQQSRHRL